MSMVGAFINQLARVFLVNVFGMGMTLIFDVHYASICIDGKTNKRKKKKRCYPVLRCGSLIYSVCNLHRTIKYNMILLH